MRPITHRVALLSGLAGLCLGIALALQVKFEVQSEAKSGLKSAGLGSVPEFDLGRTASRSADPGDITGSIGPVSMRLASSVWLPLTDEQRGHIFDGIMKLRDAPVADVPAPDTAMVMPDSVLLQELPAGVTRDVPIVQGYKFVKLDDRILLVSPRDRAVVAEMPRYRTVLD